MIRLILLSTITAFTFVSAQSIAAIAVKDQNEPYVSKYDLSTTAGDFTMGAVSVKDFATEVKYEKQRGCEDNNETTCPVFTVPVKTQKVVAVSVDYYESTGLHNYDDPQYSMEFRMPLESFTAQELATIRSAKGFKAVRLAEKMFSLAKPKIVKLPVEQDIYGECDVEENCRVIGHKTVMLKFQEVGLVRK